MKKPLPPLVEFKDQLRKELIKKGWKIRKLGNKMEDQE